MSSPLPDIARGKKIVIKFDKDLIGDVSGNHTAFTVSGQQPNPVHGGELEHTEYDVDSVERYPTPVHYDEDFEGGVSDGVEVGGNGLVLGVDILQAFTSNGTFTVPAGVDNVNVMVVGGGGGGSRQGGGGGGAGGLVLAYDVAVTPLDDIGVTIGGGGSGGNTSSAQQGGKGGISSFGAITAEGGGGGGRALTSGDTSGADGGSGGGAGRSSTYNVGGTGNDGPPRQGYDGGANTTDNAPAGGGGGANEPGGPGTTGTSGAGGNGIDLSALLGTSYGAGGWFAGGGGGGNYGGVGGNGGGGNGSISGSVNGQSGAANTGGGGGGGGIVTPSAAQGAGGAGGSGIVIVFTGGEPFEIGTYTPPPIDATTLPDDARIRWTADTPTDTSINIEYSLTATDAEPGTWTELTESEIIEINNNFLWLKYTLETTDTEVTPTLEEVWLEGLQEQDKILLNFDEQNRFNHVEGNLTVAYSQAVGNLTGEGPVEDFSETFLPLSLEPDPLDQHIITVAGTELDVDFKLFTYHDGHTDHSITVGGTEVLVDFIHVDDIVT